jgi:alpha-D-ribose 1-methylphosphonate 5-phosphate C-P lyase
VATLKGKCKYCNKKGYIFTEVVTGHNGVGWMCKDADACIKRENLLYEQEKREETEAANGNER